MRLYFSILLCGLLMAPPGLALKQAEGGAPTNLTGQELSNELNTLVQRALDEGLLAPTGSGMQGMTADTLRPEPAELALDCSQPYALDFADFRHLKQYQDMVSLRQQAAAGMPDLDVAKAQLAFDLGSEAVMNIRASAEEEADSLRRLAMLLNGRQMPDHAYFRELAACHEAASLWLALALLADGREEGASILDRNLSRFRQLPLHLRDRFAFLAIPALDKQNQRVLAYKLIATFSPEEIGNSSQLTFSHAVLELSSGRSSADATIRTFLMQGRFQEEALYTLLRNGRKIDNAGRHLLVGSLLTRLEQSQHDADIRASLRFVLEELSAQSRHIEMIAMAARENMQSEAAQTEIRQQLAEGLRRDLESDDPIRNLAAIEALSMEPGILDASGGRDQLYETAILKAVRLGFGSLADGLSRKVHPGDRVSEQRATLAFHRRDYKSVYQFAQQYPANPQIGLIAALSAIEAGDASQLAKFEPRLTLDPDTVLALIEQDAVGSRWMVPERVYRAAEGFADEDRKLRASRVLALRKSASAEGGRPGEVAIAAVPTRLNGTRNALEALGGGQ